MNECVFVFRRLRLATGRVFCFVLSGIFGTRFNSRTTYFVPRQVASKFAQCNRDYVQNMIMMLNWLYEHKKLSIEHTNVIIYYFTALLFVFNMKLDVNT